MPDANILAELKIGDDYVLVVVRNEGFAANFCAYTTQVHFKGKNLGEDYEAGADTKDEALAMGGICLQRHRSRLGALGPLVEPLSGLELYEDGAIDTYMARLGEIERHNGTAAALEETKAMLRALHTTASMFMSRKEAFRRACTATVYEQRAKEKAYRLDTTHPELAAIARLEQEIHGLVANHIRRVANLSNNLLYITALAARNDRGLHDNYPAPVFIDGYLPSK